MDERVVVPVRPGVHHVSAADVAPSQAAVAQEGERVADGGRAGFGEADDENLGFEGVFRRGDLLGEEDDRREDDGEDKENLMDESHGERLDEMTDW